MNVASSRVPAGGSPPGITLEVAEREIVLGDGPLPIHGVSGAGASIHS
jgi:hypothetical protein